MNSFANNLPPGCSSQSIEDRFGDAEELCEQCCKPLRECECEKEDEEND